MGAIGLPGDWSSVSRFIRGAFVRSHSVSEEGNGLSQFFHILSSVEQPRGCIRLEEGRQEVTLYSSCCDLERGIYYYQTYDRFGITAAELFLSNLTGNELQIMPLQQKNMDF